MIFGIFVFAVERPEAGTGRIKPTDNGLIVVIQKHLQILVIPVPSEINAKGRPQDPVIDLLRFAGIVQVEQSEFEFGGLNQAVD